ncbi:helix-turn-helix domain-containing protein [bacterium]|nr:helix-turn-helix domain-containing protein [bacterium]
MADAVPRHSAAAETDAPPAPAADAPLVADAKRLSRLLGVGLRTVRTWDAAGKLPIPLRIGGKVVWRLDELRSWLAAGAPDRAEWTARTAARRT